MILCKTEKCDIRRFGISGTPNVIYGSEKMYFDYIIVGAGLFGATFAYEVMKAGKTCFVAERRPHIGGNCYTKNVYGIDVHVYGAHIFKTNSKETWKYINQFAEFNNFVNTPIAICNGKAYNMPFNMNTFSKVFGVTTPIEARRAIANEIDIVAIGREPINLEEFAISKVGTTLYNMFIKGYTEKQWGRPCFELPKSILSDIPVRYTYNNNYYDKLYQGVPIGGYTNIIEKMLKGAEVVTGMSHNDVFSHFHGDIKFGKVVYTGAIDELFDYELGMLEYRSLSFSHTVDNIGDSYGVAVTNFVDKDVPYTRVIEHQHFCNQKSDKTVVTFEYPKEYTGNDDAFYPVESKKNRILYERYLNLAKDKFGDSVVFGGRLGSYRYDDMAECIENAVKLAKEELK